MMILMMLIVISLVCTAIATSLLIVLTAAGRILAIVASVAPTAVLTFIVAVSGVRIGFGCRVRPISVR